MNKHSATMSKSAARLYLPYFNGNHTYEEIARHTNRAVSTVRSFASIHKLTHKVKTRIQIYEDLLAEGHTIVDIAAILVQTVQATKNFCYRNNLIATRLQEYIRLIEEGKSVQEIADFFAVKKQTVYIFISRNNLEPLRKKHGIKKDDDIVFISKCPFGHKTDIERKFLKTVNGKKYVACKDSECLTFYDMKSCKIIPLPNVL